MSDRPILVWAVVYVRYGYLLFEFKEQELVFLCNCWFIKIPWVPLSISALVVTIFFPSTMCVLTCIDLGSLSDTILIFNAWMVRVLEDLDVMASLLPENPLLLWPLLLDQHPEDL